MSETQESAIAKANEVLGVNIGRPKKCKSTEASKIVEISEWSKNRKPSRSKHHYHTQVAEEAKSRGLPALSLKQTSPNMIAKSGQDPKNRSFN
ncbi:hypothetical protein [Nostoc sp. UHCC 0251]|uniref:hypothetical protein n=1 Tax=Nostoc sp. UHCC 0251 TaxID=3110240 RepID=UPI002B21E276|nr:hypothetical protein [Nostoc sp. UHCC 0251]MEA5626176.1 hypothetical protein [Nostoc sp. UHCC 0251]